MTTPAHTSSSRFAQLLACLALCGLLAGVTAASAPGKPLGEKIREKRAKIGAAKAKEGVLTKTISGYGKRISSLRGEVAGLRTRESRVQNQLAASQRELTEARNELQSARARLEKLRKQLIRARRVLSQRLIEIYKSDQPDVLTVVLEADGFTDLLQRADFLSRIGRQDRTVVNRVRGLRSQSKRTVKRLAVLEKRIEAARNTIAAKRRELAQTRGNLESRQTRLVGVRGSKRRSLASVRSDRDEHEGDLKGLEAQERRIQARLAAAAAPKVSNVSGPSRNAGPIRQGGGGMIWPVNGPLVSPFGPRWGRLHAGVDVSAPSGTPIRAAKSGKVALASPMSGYGNYLCINHGGGLSTCYAHLSSYGTSAGASVKQGQVVGAVGCTGRCFGDHLHFEVRVGGNPTDPMGYL
ncbi:MAG: murein hydrolase activator EnvC family protein [Solirubrobacterales bacterium]